MSVKIRLRRMGTKGKAFYRVVVADSRTSRDGRFIETIGTYDPRTDPATVKIDEERALLWMGRGAQPTDTTRALLKKQGIVGKFIASKAPAAAAPAVTEEVEEKKATATVEAVEEKKPAPRKKATATVKAVEEKKPAPRKKATATVEAVETTVEEPVAAETEAAAEEQPTEKQG